MHHARRHVGAAVPAHVRVRARVRVRGEILPAQHRRADDARADARAVKRAERLADREPDHVGANAETLERANKLANAVAFPGSQRPSN